MKPDSGKIFYALIVLAIVGIVSPSDLAARQAVKQRVSQPGRYEGYSEAIYDGWQRHSVYVTVRDRTKIAMDIFRPTRGGRLHSEALPVIWEHRRLYTRNRPLYSRLHNDQRSEVTMGRRVSVLSGHDR